jgi:hypothetical protein
MAHEQTLQSNQRIRESQSMHMKIGDNGDAKEVLFYRSR